MSAKANAMCLFDWTYVRRLWVAACLLGWMTVQAQAPRAHESFDLPAENATAEDLAAYRQAWLTAMNQRLGLGTPLRNVDSRFTMSLQLERNLQLRYLDPAYVPFRVVPPRSNLGGLFTEYQFGGSSFHLGGDSHVLITPNDPWNGWGRRGVAFMGTIFPNSGFLPNYWLLPGRLGPMW